MPFRARVDRLKTLFTAAKSLNYSWRLTDYLKTPNYNGVNSYCPQVHRVTIRFCKISPKSAGIRNYIEEHLPTFAQQNPSIAIYVQPIRYSCPTLRAEYGNDRIIHVNVSGCSSLKMEKWMNLLRTRSGLPNIDLVSQQSAATNSIQGIWNPLYNLSSEQNLPEWPKDKFSKYRSASPTAQQYILPSF
uniref:Large ribosomal subunit protein mL43 n=1 Tax=Syphacia muris TaxID=451379 RepID=A0A0N5AFX5_9BILA